MVLAKLKKLKNEFSPSFPWEKTGPPQPNPGLHLPPGARIPDWRSYKVSEFTPELQKLEKRLAAKGLKDPWIRNEVWRYDTRVWGTKIQRHAFIWRGLGSAALLTAVIIVVKESLPKKEHHHHDDYPLLKEMGAQKSHHH